jgi:cob(I)alamin adenosyltransferase
MVLDEFVHLLKHRYITREETQDFLAARPESLNVVLTGRGAPAWLVELADLVTDMRNIKHPARRGVTARKGIEY